MLCSPLGGCSFHVPLHSHQYEWVSYPSCPDVLTHLFTSMPSPSPSCYDDRPVPALLNSLNSLIPIDGILLNRLLLPPVDDDFADVGDEA
jgi:hypothetical protein